MKKIVLVSSVIAIILMSSFAFQVPGISKIGTDLYTVSSTSKVATADLDSLRKMVSSFYGIKNFSKGTATITITEANAKNKGGYILNKSICWSIVKTKFVKWVKAATLSEDAQKMNAIITRYADVK